MKTKIQQNFDFKFFNDFIDYNDDQANRKHLPLSSSASLRCRKISLNNNNNNNSDYHSQLHRSNSLIRFSNDLTNQIQLHEQQQQQSPINCYNQNNDQYLQLYHHQPQKRLSTSSINVKNISNDNKNKNEFIINSPNHHQSNDQLKNDSLQDINTIINLNEDLIVLSPFDNQVGGHTQIMLLNQNTLCKPLIPRELNFYLNIPRQLIGFVPKYEGCVEIRQNESASPIIYHPNKNLYNTNTNHENKPKLRVRLSICDNDRRLLESIYEQQQQQQQQQRSSFNSRPISKYFMLLENITSNYHLPCILDLKMGTRQHSDDASDEKRRRQIAKCQSTTSATLGLRICGMQIYHKLSNNKYRLYQRDKYHGRKIKNEIGLRNELEIYFLNRTYLIRPIISRLKQLRSKIKETLCATSLRFFSTSLLIVSEGCFDRTNPIRKQRLFSDGEEEFDDDDDNDDGDDDDEFDENDDFFVNDNHCNYDNYSYASTDSELSTLYNDMNDQNPTIYDDSDNEITYKCKHNHNHSKLSSTPNVKMNDNSNGPAFDIRLIDFANTSLTSSSTSVTSTAQQSNDYGFILGIDNLIRLLNEILFDAIRTRVVMMNQQRNNKRRRSSSGQNTMDSYLEFNRKISNNRKSVDNDNNDSDSLNDQNCDITSTTTK